MSGSLRSIPPALLLLDTACTQPVYEELKPAHGHEHVHHWELPSRDPDRIALTLPGDPATSVGVTWRTDPSVTQAVVEFAEETGAPRFELDKVIFLRPSTAKGFPDRTQKNPRSHSETACRRITHLRLVSMIWACSEDVTPHMPNKPANTTDHL